MTRNTLTLRQRAGLAWRVLRGDYWPRQRKASDGMLFWPMWKDGQPQWSMVDTSAFIREGFNLNALIYSAVMYKVRGLSSAPLRVYSGDPEHPERVPPGHPLAKLIARPNPYQSNIEFQQRVIVFLNLTGNAYVYLKRQGKKGLPPEMYVLRTDRVKIVPGKDNTIMGYVYAPEGSPTDKLPILPEDMMHVKFPNPLDPLEGLGEGMSPIMPMGQSGDVDNGMTRFLHKFMQTGTMLGGYLKFNMPMRPEELDLARERWNERYAGSDNWGEVAALDQSGSYERMIPNFKDMAFDWLDARNESRMVMPFGVPGMLLGARFAMQDSTFSNFEQADKVFWQNTFVPELSLVETEYQYSLSDGDAFPAFDTSGVPALQQNIPALVDAAHKMWTMGTPRRDAYEVVGLNVPETPGDQVSYVPMNLVPVGKSAGSKFIILPNPPIRAPQKSLPRKSHWTAEEKQVIWKAVDDIATSWQDKFADGAREQFGVDEQEILALVGEAEAKARQRKATINWLEVEDDVKAYLDGQGAEGWRTTFVPLLSGLVEDAGNYWSAQTGLAFDVRNLLAEAWFADYVLVFAQPINQTTSDTIHDVLAQGQAEGWSIPTMQKNLKTLFQQWMDGDLTAEDFEWFDDRLPPHRTEAIARTETTRIQNAGSFNLFKDWGVGEKEWLATNDNRTRDSHAAASGQVKGIDEAFDIGGYKMAYPGDASLGAPPSEFVDCRCAVLPVIPEDE